MGSGWESKLLDQELWEMKPGHMQEEKTWLSEANRRETRAFTKALEMEMASGKSESGAEYAPFFNAQAGQKKSSFEAEFVPRTYGQGADQFLQMGSKGGRGNAIAEDGSASPEFGKGVLSGKASAGAGGSRVGKKRSRASRRPPTTVLEADSGNFRAMVQQLTGIPAPALLPDALNRSGLEFLRAHFNRGFGFSSNQPFQGFPAMDPPNFYQIQGRKIPGTDNVLFGSAVPPYVGEKSRFFGMNLQQGGGFGSFSSSPVDSISVNNQDQNHADLASLLKMNPSCLSMPLLWDGDGYPSSNPNVKNPCLEETV